MREVIGHTRRGKDVWIEYERRQGVAYVTKLPTFHLSLDEYDCICALEAFAVRPGWRLGPRGYRLFFENLPFQVEEKLHRAWSGGVVVIGDAQGHRGATDRVNFGRRLLRVEYRW